MLLCRFNPHDKSSDPEKVSTDKTEPDDFKQLQRAFEDIATDGKPRRLAEWLAIAKARHWKFHPWIDQYIEAAKQLGISLSPPENGSARDGSNDSPPPAPSVSEASAISRATAVASAQTDTQSASGASESDAPSTFCPRVGWQIAMFEAWPAMRKLYGRDPSPIEAIKFLKANDKSGVILNKGAINELWWKPQRGIAKDLAFSTVENTISSWRTRRVLPA